MPLTAVEVEICGYPRPDGCARHEDIGLGDEAGGQLQCCLWAASVFFPSPSCLLILLKPDASLHSARVSLQASFFKALLIAVRCFIHPVEYRKRNKYVNRYIKH